MSHPAKFSPQILDALRPIIENLGLHVHDPFAGTGERLGALCDRVGVPFSGTELEPEYIVDPRVKPGNSTKPDAYPWHCWPGQDIRDCVVVTSPVYPNGMTDHFEAKDGSRRHTYRQGLAAIRGSDRPLHVDNMGRYGNAHRRSWASQAAHFDIAHRCVTWWPQLAVVNVKDVKATRYEVPVVGLWRALLDEHGYRIVEQVDVDCPGHRDGANGDLRADHEAVLVAERSRPLEAS